MIHEPKNEGTGMFKGGIHPDEWYRILVAGETSARQCFFIQPLQVVFGKRNTMRLHQWLTK